LKHSLTVHVPIFKTDAAKRLVFGFANVSVSKDGDPVTDLQDDQIPPDALEKAAYKFVLTSRIGGLEHQEMGVATLVESFFLTPEKLAAMGVSDPTYKGASWWVGFRVDDPDTWDRVQKGELRAFSIGGEGTYENVNADA
jgi:hypothetical protein